MGLDDYALNETADLHITTPRGEKLMQVIDGVPHPVVITLLRDDCAEAQRYRQKVMNERIRKVKATGEFEDGISAEQAQQEITRVLVLCTKAWKNVWLGNKEVPCTPENVEALYTDTRFPWIRDQVFKFINKDSNFLGNSSNG